MFALLTVIRFAHSCKETFAVAGKACSIGYNNLNCNRFWSLLFPKYFVKTPRKATAFLRRFALSLEKISRPKLRSTLQLGNFDGICSVLMKTLDAIKEKAGKLLEKSNCKAIEVQIIISINYAKRNYER